MFVKGKGHEICTFKFNKINLMYIYGMDLLKKTTILLVLILAINACKTNKYSFLNNYPIKELPLIDSTSFSNHMEGLLLSKEQQNLLGLSNVFGEALNNTDARVGVSYLPKISDNFKSVVYYLYSSNTELTSVLVNYDDNYKVINTQMIAYDEIADGLLKSTAMIYKDKIVLKEFISENASIIKYDILENGDITRE